MRAQSLNATHDYDTAAELASGAAADAADLDVDGVMLSGSEDGSVDYQAIITSFGARFNGINMYADDVVLMAGMAADLNGSPVGLQKFCLHWILEVNLSESKAMAVGLTPQEYDRGLQPIYYQNQQLECVLEYEYLVVRSAPGMALFIYLLQKVTEFRAAQANEALHAVVALCRDNRLLRFVSLRLRLFECSPSGDWGCLVWAGQYVASASYSATAQDNQWRRCTYGSFDSSDVCRPGALVWPCCMN